MRSTLTKGLLLFAVIGMTDAIRLEQKALKPTTTTTTEAVPTITTTTPTTTPTTTVTTTATTEPVVQNTTVVSKPIVIEPVVEQTIVLSDPVLVEPIVLEPLIVQDSTNDLTSSGTGETLDNQQTGTCVPVPVCGYGCPSCTNCAGCSDCGNPCLSETNFCNCLDITIAGNCNLPPATPYTFTTCCPSGTGCLTGGCVHTQHLDDFTLCGSHEETFPSVTLITEQLTEGEASADTRVKSCGCGKLNKTFTICGDITTIVGRDGCAVEGFDECFGTYTSTTTDTKSCTDGVCESCDCPLSCDVCTCANGGG